MKIVLNLSANFIHHILLKFKKKLFNLFKKIFLKNSQTNFEKKTAHSSLNYCKSKNENKNLIVFFIKKN